MDSYFFTTCRPAKYPQIMKIMELCFIISIIFIIFIISIIFIIFIILFQALSRRKALGTPPGRGRPLGRRRQSRSYHHLQIFRSSSSQNQRSSEDRRSMRSKVKDIRYRSPDHHHKIKDLRSKVFTRLKIAKPTISEI